ncbi:MAG: L-threonylcarbamoyladenylate synthase [Opitutaceae bacterium]
MKRRGKQRTAGPGSARILAGTPANLRALAGVLKRGGLVGVPTETVYGLAADALDAAACAGIYRAKRRPPTDPLIVHVLGLREAETIAHLNPAARRLAAAFWPGPLTLVLEKRAEVPDIVTAGLGSVAVRVPAHALFRRLLRATGRPLAAPSANPFGYVSPTTAEHVRAGLGERIRHILDGGPCAVGLESTIVDVRDPARPRLLRPGAITREQLEKVLRRKVGSGRTAGSARQAQLAPGMLKRHYSPRTPVTLHARLSAKQVTAGGKKDAWVFAARPKGVTSENIFWLDPRGDLRGAARRLFALLRRLDSAGHTRIHLEKIPGRAGLAEALNDRMARAAARG